MSTPKFILLRRFYALDEGNPHMAELNADALSPILVRTDSIHHMREEMATFFRYDPSTKKVIQTGHGPVTRLVYTAAYGSSHHYVDVDIDELARTLQAVTAPARTRDPAPPEPSVTEDPPAPPAPPAAPDAGAAPPAPAVRTAPPGAPGVLPVLTGRALLAAVLCLPVERIADRSLVWRGPRDWKVGPNYRTQHPWWFDGLPKGDALWQRVLMDSPPRCESCERRNPGAVGRHHWHYITLVHRGDGVVDNLPDGWRVYHRATLEPRATHPHYLANPAAYRDDDPNMVVCLPEARGLRARLPWLLTVIRGAQTCTENADVAFTYAPHPENIEIE